MAPKPTPIAQPDPSTQPTPPSEELHYPDWGEEDDAPDSPQDDPGQDAFWKGVPKPVRRYGEQGGVGG